MVNTFLSHFVSNQEGQIQVRKSFEKTFHSLDASRRNKQRVEAMQIYNALTQSNSKGWKNHPAALMWKGYEELLAWYHNICLDIMKEKGVNTEAENLPVVCDIEDTPRPWWFGWIALQESHRSALIRKHPVFYRWQFSMYEPWALERGYLWPSKLTAEVLEQNSEEHPEWYAPVNWDTAKNRDKSKKNALTVSQLKDCLRKNEISFSNKMKKDELVNLLTEEQIQQYLMAC